MRMNEVFLVFAAFLIVFIFPSLHAYEYDYIEKIKGPVYINTVPSGARIIVDSEELDEITPRRIFVEVGKRDIILRKRGFEDHAIRINVDRYKESKIKIDLVKIEEKEPAIERPAILMSDFFKPDWRCKTDKVRGFEFSPDEWSHKEYCQNGCENGECKPTNVIANDFMQDKYYMHADTTIYEETQITPDKLIHVELVCKNEYIRGYKDEKGKWIWEEYCPFGCKEGKCNEKNIVAFDHKPKKTYKNPEPTNIFFFNLRNLIPYKYRTNETYSYRR